MTQYTKMKGPLAAVALGLSTLTVTGPAAAQGFFADIFGDMSYSFGGFVRAESAFRTTSIENPNNQGGNLFNDVTAPVNVFSPPNFPPVVLVPGATWTTVPLPAFDRDVRRGDFIQSDDNDFNYTVLRAEAELGINFSNNLRLITRVRGVYDPGIYDEFNENSVAALQGGGIDVGPWVDPQLYNGSPNYFEYRVTDGNGGFSNGNPLELTGSDYQIYLPAFVLEYTQGDLNVRLGNQQIAWGQALFFRVFDVPNGLDLRRHSILDRALEEFSDKRVPMLSARATYQATNEILLDGYVGKFQPTVLGNPNTPYNIIPVQFTVEDSYKSGGFDDELVYGVRAKADYGGWGWQAAAVRRIGPEGTFRWTMSGVDRDLTGPLGNLVNTTYATLPPCSVADLGPGLCRQNTRTGESLAETAFAVSPGGVYSANEWFRYAADVRLDGVIGLNASIREFEAAQDVFASEIANVEEATNQLNTFFAAAGGSLRGHIERTYHHENLFMLGASYVLESDVNFLNQMIFNFEVQYTPERNFTNIGLEQAFIEQDEYIAALVIDKWHRFSNNFPATYMVFQAFTRNRGDLVGRHLSGYGGRPLEELAPDATRSTSGKSGNANYIVFGFSQPFPNRIYEIEFATLFDPEGGIFAQPGVRWNPGNGVTVEGFYNYTNGRLWGRETMNVVSTLDFAEEFTLRLTYQF